MPGRSGARRQGAGAMPRHKGRRRMKTKVLIALALVVGGVAGGLLVVLPHRSSERVGRIVHACPRGQAREQGAVNRPQDRGQDADRRKFRPGLAPGCEPRFAAESYADLSRANSWWVLQDRAALT